MIWKIGLLPSNKHGRISCNRRKKSPRETTILLSSLPVSGEFILKSPEGMWQFSPPGTVLYF